MPNENKWKWNARKRSKTMCIRVDSDTYQKIKTLAHELGLSISAYLRKLLKLDEEQ